MSLIGQLIPRITALRAMSKYPSKKMLKNIAESTIISKVSIGIELWGGIPLYLQQRLQSMLIQTARIVIGPQLLRMSAEKMFLDLNWLGFSQLSAYITTKTANKIEYIHLPLTLHENIQKENNIQFSPRTRNQRNGYIRQRNWRKNVSRNSFTYRAINLLNNIPENIKTMRERMPKKYKISLKTYIQQTNPVTIRQFPLQTH